MRISALLVSAVLLAGCNPTVEFRARSSDIVAASQGQKRTGTVTVSMRLPYGLDCQKFTSKLVSDTVNLAGGSLQSQGCTSTAGYRSEATIVATGPIWPAPDVDADLPQFGFVVGKPEDRDCSFGKCKGIGFALTMSKEGKRFAEDIAERAGSKIEIATLRLVIENDTQDTYHFTAIGSYVDGSPSVSGFEIKKALRERDLVIETMSDVSRAALLEGKGVSAGAIFKKAE